VGKEFTVLDSCLADDKRLPASSPWVKNDPRNDTSSLTRRASGLESRADVVKRQVSVSIAGQRLLVKSAASDAYIRTLAGFVEGKIREAHGERTAPLSAVALAALNIADDLFRERAGRAALRKKVRERSRRLLDLLKGEGG
jgi:cell division protein ZapA (FtsZ GTPase activity inhibitor)